MQHDGSAGDVIVQGLLMGAGSKSGNLRLAGTGSLRSQGALSPMLRMGPGQRPWLALYDHGRSPITVTAKMHYRTGTGEHRMALDSIRVDSDSVHGKDLSAAVGALPSGARDLGLSLEHSGVRGSLVSELLVVHAGTGSVAQATPKDTRGEGAGGLSFAWRLQGQARTVLAFANPSARETVTFHAFLFYNGETYGWPGQNTLRPGEVRPIDVRQLRDEKVAGLDGKTIPETVVSGQAKVFVHNSAIGRGNQLIGQAFQESAGMLSAYLSCPVCPPSPTGLELSPSQFTGHVDTSQSIYADIQYDDGSSCPVVNANAIAWSSGNSQDATVSESGSSFTVEFEGAGNTTVSATADECVYGPDDTGSDSVDECLCQYLAALQAAPVAVTATCPVPTGEVTTSDGWSFPAVHRFEQRLTPFGTSFVGRWFSESDAAPATDSCWFQDSNYDPMSGVSGGAWRVTPGNNWGPDSVGYDYTPLIWYYREQRPMNDLPMPCGWTVYQRLEITSCGPGSTASVYRPSVTLEAEMSLTEVSASRDGIEASRVLLTP